jgi:hypothetical protein
MTRQLEAGDPLVTSGRLPIASVFRESIPVAVTSAK